MRRSNPGSFRGKILDCFAALAMTSLWLHCPPQTRCHRPRRRTIQYAAAAVSHREAAAYWIPRSSARLRTRRGMTVRVERRSRPQNRLP
ncbi:hypothetical protein CO669_01980 [Bradyrhizobium sp. Y36]|nr:hypothetical protein CO669_01980 [Bradyrhizobium sp. Y36]